MCERAERDEGETLVEGLPRSTLHKFSRTMSFVPAGHRFCGWQKPRMLTRVTYFYIDPRGPLIDPELHFAETELKPRLFFFDNDLWETALKLKAQAEHSGPGQRQYVEALSIVMVHELLRLNNGAAWPQRRIFAAASPAGRRNAWRNTSRSTFRKTSRSRRWRILRG